MKVLKEKLGQMILLGLDVEYLNDEVIKIIKDFKIGGIILYKKNYKNISEMINFINKIKEINDSNIPLFISIDQENGRVNRLPSDILRILNPMKQVNSGIKIVNEVNDITVDILKKVGVNMNFAPVVDIRRDKEEGIVGNRSYGDNYLDVCKYALPFMKKMQDNGIISVIKHFPGHGMSSKDSHLFLPKIKDTKTVLENDIKVYEEAIKNGVDGIMIGHLIINGYGKEPATLNKRVIDELLINKYNYNGLIVTDDLVMNTIKYKYGIKNAFIKCVFAGNDLIIVKYRKGDYKLYNDLIYHDYQDEFIKRVDDSYNKIINMKEKYNINNDKIVNNIDINLINDRIEKVNDKMN